LLCEKREPNVAKQFSNRTAKKGIYVAQMFPALRRAGASLNKNRKIGDVSSEEGGGESSSSKEAVIPRLHGKKVGRKLEIGVVKARPTPLEVS